jgi:hypothetical protein
VETLFRSILAQSKAHTAWNSNHITHFETVPRTLVVFSTLLHSEGLIFDSGPRIWVLYVVPTVPQDKYLTLGDKRFLNYPSCFNIHNCSPIFHSTSYSTPRQLTESLSSKPSNWHILDMNLFRNVIKIQAVSQPTLLHSGHNDNDTGPSSTVQQSYDKCNGNGSSETVFLRIHRNFLINCHSTDVLHSPATMISVTRPARTLSKSLSSAGNSSLTWFLAGLVVKTVNLKLSTFQTGKQNIVCN